MEDNLESFYGVAIISIKASGFFGRLNLLSENRLGYVLIRLKHRRKMTSIHSPLYKYSLRFYC